MLALQPRLQGLNLLLQLALAARRTRPLEGPRPVLEEAPLPLIEQAGIDLKLLKQIRHRLAFQQMSGKESLLRCLSVPRLPRSLDGRVLFENTPPMIAQMRLNLPEMRFAKSRSGPDEVRG